MGALNSEQFSKEGAVYFLAHSTDTENAPGWLDRVVRQDDSRGLIEVDAQRFLQYFESNYIGYAEGFVGFSHFAESGNPVFISNVLEVQAGMSLEKARSRYGQTGRDIAR